MIEYILIGTFVGIFLLMLLTYFINSKKINKSSKKLQKENKDDKKDDNKKVEVPSEMSAQKPVDKAISEANYEYNMKEAFEKIEQQRAEYENTPKSVKDNSRLKLDRGEFKTELQRSLEANTISSETNIISSSTAKMDFEISSQSKEGNVNIDKQIAEEYEKEHSKSQKLKNLAEEINNMSPQAKAVLINDILNKKY